ncbi:MAG: CBS domain-containing protein [Deltaproteobacteria bacterium]|nr:CBS domain-containing protein [Deltaproteobacteria bacterium]
MLQALSDVKAKDLMVTNFLTLTGDKLVADAVNLMDKENRGSVWILNQKGELVSLFTERDLIRRVVSKGLDPKKTLLEKVVTSKLVSAHVDDEAFQLLELMCENNFRHLPVLKAGKLVGTIGLKHFYQFFLDKQQSMGV